MSATEILELSATAASAAVASGELSADELFRAYLARAEDDRAAGGDGLNCFTWVAEDVPSRRRCAGSSGSNQHTERSPATG